MPNWRQNNISIRLVKEQRFIGYKKEKKVKNIENLQNVKKALKKLQNKTAIGNKEIDQKVLSRSELKSSYLLPLMIFKEVWNNWLKYLKQIKKTYESNMCIQQIFKKFAKFAEMFVIEKLIEKSIANGWRRV